MNIITSPVEPVSLALARLQCKLDADGDPPSHPDDQLLQIYIGDAREYAETMLGHRVARVVVETALAAFPSGEVELEGAPLFAVDSVKYLDQDGDLQTLDAGTYVVDASATPALLRLAPSHSWPATSISAAAVTIRYTLGYSAVGDDDQTKPLPNSIVAAMLLVIAHRYRNREDSTVEAMQSIPLGAAAQLYPIKTRLGFA